MGHRYAVGIELRLVLDAVADAVVALDATEHVVYANRSVAGLLGWSSDELIGRRLSDLLPGGRPDSLGTPQRAHALRQDGSLAEVDVTFTATSGAGSELFVATLRRLRDGRSSRHHLLAEHGVMSVLSEAKSLEEAAPRLLQTICEMLRWDAGVLWMTDASDRLRSAADWGSPWVLAHGFLETSRLMHFERGEGPPGRAWQTRKPLVNVHLDSDPTYPRGELAARAGLNTAYVFPIVCANESRAVMEFLRRDPHEPDAYLMRTITTIGFQIGQFLERVRAQDELRLERDRLHRVFEQAPAAIAIVRAPDFRYELSNPMNQLLAGGRDMVGKTVDEVLPELQAQGFKAILAEACRTGETFVGKEVPITLQEGDSSSRQFFVNGMYKPLVDEDGAVSGVFAFAYDVTEQVEARKQAEEAQQSLALLANAVPQIIWAATPRGKLEFINRRWYEYTGLKEARLTENIGVDLWSNACHPDDLPRMLDMWNKCFVTERAVSKRHFGGLGLGLWIVRQIVESLGGTISVTSQPGLGSGFTVTLPLAPGPPTDAAAAGPVSTIH